MLYLALYIRFNSPAVSKGTVGGTPTGGIVGIVFIYLYAFGWSFGHSVACYVVAAEIFPTRIVRARIQEIPQIVRDSLTSGPLALVLHVLLLLHQLDRRLRHHTRHAPHDH
jgi:ABC-type uncharacterized transport system YnjBCD permease subunit